MVKDYINEYLEKLDVSYSKLRKKKSAAREKQLQDFQKKLGICFKNIDFLDKALTHRSWYKRTSRHVDLLYNQRLEFLGDSILDAIISEYLFCVYHFLDEGGLSKLKSSVVSRRVLSVLAYQKEIPSYIRAGKSEKKLFTGSKSSILGDTLEALIGAYLLDSGYDECSKFVLTIFVPLIEKNLKKGRAVNYKSMLQEITQKRSKTVPVYRISHTEGPSHRKQFWVQVEINQKVLAEGSGYTKKEAEVKAAKKAFETYYSDAVGEVSMSQPAGKTERKEYPADDKESGNDKK